MIGQFIAITSTASYSREVRSRTIRRSPQFGYHRTSGLGQVKRRARLNGAIRQISVLSVVCAIRPRPWSREQRLARQETRHKQNREGDGSEAIGAHGAKARGPGEHQHIEKHDELVGPEQAGDSERKRKLGNHTHDDTIHPSDSDDGATSSLKNKNRAHDHLTKAIEEPVWGGLR